MSSLRNRVIITEKGKKLQEEYQDSCRFSTRTRLLINPQVDFPSICRPLVTSEKSGYFRPQHPTHLTIKTSESHRLYPNYLRSKPNEYPHKHECDWNLKSSVEGSKNQILSPIGKSIHHSLFKFNQESLENPKIKEMNNLTEDKHGYIPLNLTTCKYPESNSFSSHEVIESLKDSIKIISPKGLSNKKVNENLLNKSLNTRSSWKFSDNLNSPLKTATSFFEKSLQTERSFHKKTNKLRTETETTLSPSNLILHRVAIKSSENKSEQLIGKYLQQQKEYDDLLQKMEKKIRDNHERKQENPNYFDEINEKIKKSESILQNLSIVKERENIRYKVRLADRSKKKFGEAWKKWGNFMNRTQTVCPSKIKKELNEQEDHLYKLVKRSSQIEIDKRNSQVEVLMSAPSNKSNHSKFDEKFLDFIRLDSNFTLMNK